MTIESLVERLDSIANGVEDLNEDIFKFLATGDLKGLTEEIKALSRSVRYLAKEVLEGESK